jgi:hypothetical protein
MSTTPDHELRRLRRPCSCWTRCGPIGAPTVGCRRSRPTGTCARGFPALLQLAPLHDVVRTWQAHLAAAPAVDGSIASGCDDSDGVALEDVLPPRAAR